MRRKFNAQSRLFSTTTNNPIARELEQISRILDETPRLLDPVYRDMVGTKRHDTGRLWRNAEQVLRCAVLKQYSQLSYEELAFHLADSSAFRGFSRLEMGQYPCKSILQDNTKSLREETWEAIHEELLGYARREGIETGRRSTREGHRSDPTVRLPKREGCRIGEDRFLLRGAYGYPRQGRSGHPVWLRGASSLILDCLIECGTPRRQRSVSAASATA